MLVRSGSWPTTTCPVTGDVGNRGYWVGTVSLFVEAALVVLSIGMLMAIRKRASSPSTAVGAN